MTTEREEKNRTTLVKKARALFFAEGFVRLTMETIAARVGVSKATLYKYFPSKESLVSAVVDLQLSDFDEKLKELEAVRPPFSERFTAFLGIAFSTMRPAMGAFLSDFSEKTPGEWRKIEAFRRKRAFTYLASLLEEGVELGMIRKEVGAANLIPILIAVIEHFAQPDVFRNLPVSAEEALGSFIGILFQGILTDSGRAQFKEKEGGLGAFSMNTFESV